MAAAVLHNGNQSKRGAVMAPRFLHSGVSGDEEKGVENDEATGYNHFSMILAQPIPKNLREQMLKHIETASEEEVVFLHDMLLFAEKDRLWKEIQEDAAAEQRAGKLDSVAELVRQYRDTKRPA